MKKFVFWDWNGTILDDVETGLLAMNAILEKYNLPLLKDMTDYREHFGFPVQDYYAKLGLGPDIFPVVSHEWVAEYNRLEGACGLRAGVEDALWAFRKAGINQVILSASKRESLLKQMERYPIAHYFEEVVGLDHIYATSKIEVGRAYLVQEGIDGSDCVMIGDTQHDADVAKALGMRCILVAGGHQTRETLEACGCEVAGSFVEATQLVLGE